MSLLAAYAFRQSDRAGQQTRLAVARQLSAQAESLRESRPDVSMMLSVAAMDRDETGGLARSGLLSTLAGTRLEARLDGHPRGVGTVAFSPDGKRLASISSDGTMILWDVATHRQLYREPGSHERDTSALAFSPDGTRLAATTADDSVRTWSVAPDGTLTPAGTLPMETLKKLYGLAYSADGHLLALTVADRTVRLWADDVPAGSLPLPDAAYGLTFASRGRLLVTADSGGHVILWDLTNPRKPVRLAQVTSVAESQCEVALSRDGRFMLTEGAADGTAQLWNIQDPRQPAKVSVLAGHAGGLYDLAFYPDGRHAVMTGTDGTGVLWDLSNPAAPVRTATLNGHASQVASTAVSPDGKLVATGTNNGIVRLWRTADPQPARIGAFPGKPPG
ncbi:WD40 repeat domain-containing protein [Paractinoplanes durhamensis]|uniref:WD40 repeat domain-containing protein n=1 Tax=Paractinoplanes durhamensis TaxID=113563 RepID=UPI0036353170